MTWLGSSSHRRVVSQSFCPSAHFTVLLSDASLENVTSHCLRSRMPLVQWCYVQDKLTDLISSIGGKCSPVQCTWINTTKNHSRIRWTTSSVTQDVTKPCYLLLISLNHYWGTRICSIDISKCINVQWPPVSIKLCSVALHATSKGNLSLHFCLCLATWAAQTTMGNFNSWNLSFFCFSLFDNVTTMQERLLLSFRSSSRFLLKWQNHKEQVKTLALVKTVLK